MTIRSLTLVLAAVAAAALAGCGSSTPAPTTATMTVRLVDAPSGDYQQVNVDVQTVEIAGSGGWVTLGQPNVVVNLLSLTGGVTQTLVNGATLQPGTYTQMRLVLGSRNTVKLADGTVEDLKVPSGQQSGVKMPVNFVVQPGTTADVFIDFDARNSVFVHPAGNSQQYILRPVVRAFDKLVTGSISGTLTDAGNAAPLGGVTVTAQTLSAEVPAVARATTTAANGTYTLDLLPIDGTYFVVAQPVVPAAGATPAVSYVARASAGIPVTSTTPTPTWSGAFDRATATGGVAGHVTPVAVSTPALTQTDTVQVRGTVAAAGTPHPFVLRAAPAVVASAAETYAFTLLPVAMPDGTTTYTVIGTRRSVDGSGNETSVQSAPVAAPVGAGKTATADLAFSP